MTLWWTLPGPAAYVDRVLDELRGGRNVAICLPAHTPPGLAAAVHARASDEWGWRGYDASDPIEPDPARQLFDAFVDENDHGAIRNARALAHQKSLADRIHWIEPVPAVDAGRWAAFLAEYERACRDIEPSKRALLCLSLAGTGALAAPPAENCLAVLRYEAFSDEIDMLIYASAVMRTRSLESGLRKLAVNTVCQLARWDPAVVDLFADADLDSILQPRGELNALAARRGWCIDEAVKKTWCRGTFHQFDGALCTHSALLASSTDPNDLHELDHRVWLAQVGSLLPLVEQRRRKLIETHGERFRIPHHFDEPHRQPITDRRHLELSHLHYQIERQQAGVPPGVRAEVRRLKAVRDRLAHLEVVTGAEIVGLFE